MCAAITPWNFPAAMITRKVGAGAGGRLPDRRQAGRATPFSALAMAVLAERAGVPKGVLNIVTGDAEGDRRRDDRAIRSCASCRSPARPRSAGC